MGFLFGIEFEKIKKGETPFIRLFLKDEDVSIVLEWDYDAAYIDQQAVNFIWKKKKLKELYVGVFGEQLIFDDREAICEFKKITSRAKNV